MNVARQPFARLADYAYAGWRQVHGWVSRARPEDFADGPSTPVLVIPGVYERWQFMLPLVRELHGAGHPVHVVSTLRSNSAPVPRAAQLVSEYLAARELCNVTIVAHSKGGLIGKHVMGFGDASDRVRHMVAIATPFGGSRYADLMIGRTLRAFRPGDETLTLLAKSLTTNERIVSVYPSFDPHIPEGSRLDGAHNLIVATSGHFRILSHRDTRSEVMRVAGAKRLD